MPYYLVPRALSDIKTKLGNKLKPSNPTTTANMTNEDGVIAGDADFYAWGLSDGKEAGKASNDVRAIGMQSFPFTSRRTQFIAFSVNTYDRWSNASTNEFDISVDVNNDGVDDYVVVGVDQGAVQTGTFNGRMGAFVFSTRSAGASLDFLAQAPTDSATANLFVLSSQLCRAGEPCLNAANPRFTYHAVSFDLNEGGVPDEVDGSAKYNAVVTRHLDRRVPDGRSGRYRSGDDRRQRSRVGDHARTRHHGRLSTTRARTVERHRRSRWTSSRSLTGSIDARGRHRRPLVVLGGRRTCKCRLQRC